MLCLALGACHPAAPTPAARIPAQSDAAQPDTAQRDVAEDDSLVLCARGQQPLARTCTIEQTTTRNGLVLTIRRPDGGFHRLLVTRDGRGVVAADGAETAEVSIAGPNLIDVTLGDERYRLPATVTR